MITATFIIYVLGMLLVGIIAYRRTQDLCDYILGGRRLSSFVTALSAGASDMSGWLLLGLPGYAYASGCGSLWLALGFLIGTYCNWRFIAHRLRVRTVQADNALTISEYLESRFPGDTRSIQLISGMFILVFFMLYTTSGLVAGGKLFESVFAVPYRTAVLLGASTIILYTLIGGFLAVCWTDCVQGLLMLLALAVLPLIMLGQAGGPAAATEALLEVNPARLNPFLQPDGRPLTFLAILSLLGRRLGYFGRPHILTRFMAIRSPSEIPHARSIAMGWVFISLAGAVLIGLFAPAIVPTPLTGADTEKVFIIVVELLLHPIPAGICLAAILAAIMSTADSQLLVASSVLSEDFYRDLFRRKASSKELVLAGRSAVILIALAASILSLNPKNMVLDLVAYAWAGFGAAFGPVLLLSLYWSKTNRRGALAGILGGGLTVILWRNLEGGVFDLYEIVPGFCISLLLIVAFSLPPKRGPTGPSRSPKGVHE